MLLALQAIDYGLAVLFLAVLLAAALFYFGARVAQAPAFLLAQRRLAWPTLGLALVTGLVSSESLSSFVGLAYRAGTGMWVWPLALVLAAAVVWCLVLPLFVRLQLGSPLEYLELRFDARVRAAALVLCLVWQATLFVALAAGAGYSLARDAGLGISGTLVVALFGVLTILTAALGGQAGATWSAAARTVVLLAGVACATIAVAGMFPGGSRQWNALAVTFGRRAWPADALASGLPYSWFWLVPHLVLGYLTLHVANPLVTQRYLAARNLTELRYGFSLYVLAGAALLAGLGQLGTGILGYYQTRPHELRPIWIANLDHRTRQPLVVPTTGEPLLDWHADGPALDAATFDRARFERLISEGRLLHPNSGEVWADSRDLLNGEGSGLAVEKLLLRDPRSSEIAVHPQAPRAMLPRFLVGGRPLLVAGMLLALLVAAALAAGDAVLLALGLLLTVDGLGRFRLGRARLARWLGRADEKLTAADEVTFARGAMITVGLAGTAAAACLWPWAPSVWQAAEGMTACGAALLAVFLLGLGLRRAGPRAALAALAAGLFTAIGLAAAAMTGAAVGASPVVCACGVALGVGLLVALVAERTQPKNALRGLVWGHGELGVQPASAPRVLPEAASRPPAAAPPATRRPNTAPAPPPALPVKPPPAKPSLPQPPRKEPPAQPWK